MSQLKYWNGTAWAPVIVGAQGSTGATGATGPAGTATVYRWTKSMSGGETSLSGNDSNSVPLQYTVGQELLHINGILQVRGTDYVASTGSTITGLAALSSGDIVDIWSPGGFSVGDSYTQVVANSTFPLNTSSYFAGKNKIINGDFSIWQRGTSFSNPGGVYTADRWDLSYDGSGTTRTISRQTFTPGAAPVVGYEGKYFYRYARSGGTGGTVDYLLRQKVEDVRTFAGQTVTVSFWAKADAARNMGLDFFQIFGTGGSSSVYVGVGTYGLTTSWQRFTTTVTIPSVAGKTINDVDGYLLLSYYVSSVNATWTVDIWGVQLEAGSVATAFTEAGGGSTQAELALCQRYYFRFTAENSATAFFGSATNPTTTQGNAWIQYPVTMRTKPTSVDSASLCIREASGTRRSMSSIVLETNGTNANLAFIYGTISGGTVNIPAQLAADNTTSAYIGFSAEL